MRKRSDSSDRATLSALDRIMGRPEVRSRVDAAARRLTRKLDSEPTAQMAWETVPLAVYDPGLPEAIRSSWVFILRGGAVTGAERHPNSHQRTLSYVGTGDLQTRRGGRWQSHALRSDAKAALGRKWVSIPANTWHQVVVPGGDWVVVSFHTAPADELIEERPGAENPRDRERRLYVGESAR